MNDNEEISWASEEEALEEWRGRTFPGLGPTLDERTETVLDRWDDDGRPAS